MWACFVLPCGYRTVHNVHFNRLTNGPSSRELYIVNLVRGWRALVMIGRCQPPARMQTFLTVCSRLSMHLVQQL